MKMAIKIALVPLVCSSIYANDVNVSKELIVDLRTVKSSTLSPQDKKSLDNFLELKEKRNAFKQQQIKRMKSLHGIETDCKKSELVVKEMKKMAENPEPYIRQSQIKQLDEKMRMYEELGMTDKVKFIESLKSEVNKEQGEK